MGGKAFCPVQKKFKLNQDVKTGWLVPINDYDTIYMPFFKENHGVMPYKSNNAPHCLRPLNYKAISWSLLLPRDKMFINSETRSNLNYFAISFYLSEDLSISNRWPRYYKILQNVFSFCIYVHQICAHK